MAGRCEGSPLPLPSVRRYVIRRPLVLCGFIVLTLLIVGCQKEVAVAPDNDASYGFVDPELVARQLVAEAGWPVEKQEMSTSEPGEAEPRGGLFLQASCERGFGRNQ
jgi:hypothetical protein